MLISHCFLSGASLLALTALAGCAMFSSAARQSPSPLSGRPPPQERQEKHENQGGFTVLVGAPGQPTAARVVADIGAFAQKRGFVRQSTRPAPQADPLAPVPERYRLGEIVLDVTYRAADLRVSAYLHSFSSGLGRKFTDQFCHDFDQEYAGRYGEEDPILESAYADDAGGPPR